MIDLKRDIQNLIQILLRNNVPAIYPAEIAHLLHCEVKSAEDVLFKMVDEEKLEQAYELHCSDCGEVIGVFECPDLSSNASVPCPACYTQMETVTMNEMVKTFYPLEHRRVLYPVLT